MQPYRQEKSSELLSLIRHIRQDDPEYPEAFRHYPRMPREFYVLGNLPDPAKKTVSIVGSRACSPYGKSEAIRFGRFFAEHGIQVVSGMAYGIDAWSQHGALEGGGQTFAVLGSGVDICYPSSNYALYRRIIREGGGIISEFEPGSAPNAWHFPIRNRLISAFADVLLVVEARLRSGSLITVDYAIEQGKTIYAVPGRNQDRQSQGCNRLISEGAGIALDPSDILDELGIPSGSAHLSSSVSEGRAGYLQIPGSPQMNSSHKTGRGAAHTVSGTRSTRPDNSSYMDATAPERKLPPKWAHADDYQKVFRHLEKDPLSLDALQKASGLDISSLTSVLMQLCISGYAEEIFPGYYIRVS